jgi:hypothetical protein
MYLNSLDESISLKPIERLMNIGKKILEHNKHDVEIKQSLKIWLGLIQQVK